MFCPVQRFTGTDKAQNRSCTAAVLCLRVASRQIAVYPLAGGEPVVAGVALRLATCHVSCQKQGHPSIRQRVNRQFIAASTVLALSVRAVCLNHFAVPRRPCFLSTRRVRQQTDVPGVLLVQLDLDEIGN